MDFLQELLTATVRMTTPLLFVALGELYSERVGLVNIGLDGIMTFGASVGFMVGFFTGNPYLGLLAGALAGVSINMIFAFCTITLSAEQIIYGMALNILAPALSTFLYRMAFGIQASLIQGPSLQNIPIPLLSDIPIIGKALFDQTFVVYILYIIVIATMIFFNKTKLGLNYKAVGEYPKAAESLGINVFLLKYIGCILCGALAGLGGAFLTTGYINTYSEGIVSGRGFIALSAVIFGRWMPSGVVIATLLFGFSDALQLRLQILSPSTPYQLVSMLPYVFTLVALAVFGIKKAGPKANGKPYLREQH
ncbi:putative ABC-type transport system, permease component [Desulfosporosinus orientis DSM 765]|uniref:Putative ABC-type transport system, permease component n=1 Tax=Desulfosporosinus orientis (strain ATCC 19365 / DSM 765 / NCIMB 8382 / VKM B-1628 / Singapore I) TaxID=768706 RepID=G7WJ27_DESOD|nr:ABC transporter permease [Desulfosporosinus orientis]AET70339.1 putative ABC-type transport system, permease component [Desulfosporosinus orientis DSM 765]